MEWEWERDSSALVCLSGVNAILAGGVFIKLGGVYPHGGVGDDGGGVGMGEGCQLLLQQEVGE